MTSVNEKSNRILFIDILRGLTLLGVMLVNAVTINGPYFLDGIDFAFKFSELDHILSGIVSFLLLEKSYPVFVFLFGLSNQLLLNKLLQTLPSQKVFKIYLKRMFVLGIIGTLHLAFFYWGDVLLTYALLGSLVAFLMQYVFKSNYARLFKFNIILVIISVIMNGYVYYLVNADQYHGDFEDYYVEVLSKAPKQDIVAIQSNQKMLNTHSNNSIFIKLYQEGSVTRILYLNIYSYLNSFFAGLYKPVDLAIGIDSVNYFIEVIILMLLGIQVANLQILNNKIINYPDGIYIKIISVSGVIYMLAETVNFYEISVFSWIHVFNIFILINNIIFCIATLAYIYKFLNKFNRGYYLEKFSLVGRMTLTWYLLHSVVMSLVLFRYGFGLYGKIGVTDCIMLTLVYYYFCYTVSPFWLKKFKQGPIEKLWRYLTMPRILNSI